MKILGIILGILILTFVSFKAMAEPVSEKVDQNIYQVKLVPEKVAYFIESEKLKTIAFQKDKWLEGQEQLQATKNKILNLFTK